MLKRFLSLATASIVALTSVPETLPVESTTEVSATEASSESSSATEASVTNSSNDSTISSSAASTSADDMEDGTDAAIFNASVTNDLDLIEDSLSATVPEGDIIISGPLPEDAVLSVNTVTNTEDAEAAIVDILPEDQELQLYAVYDISITTDQTESGEYQPSEYNNELLMSLPTVELQEDETLIVFHIPDEGPAEIVGDNTTLTIDGFSLYGLGSIRLTGASPATKTYPLTWDLQGGNIDEILPDTYNPSAVYILPTPTYFNNNDVECDFLGWTRNDQARITINFQIDDSVLSEKYNYDLYCRYILDKTYQYDCLSTSSTNGIASLTIDADVGTTINFTTVSLETSSSSDTTATTSLDSVTLPINLDIEADNLTINVTSDLNHGTRLNTLTVCDALSDALINSDYVHLNTITDAPYNYYTQSQYIDCLNNTFSGPVSLCAIYDDRIAWDIYENIDLAPVSAGTTTVSNLITTLYFMPDTDSDEQEAQISQYVDSLYPADENYLVSSLFYPDYQYLYAYDNCAQTAYKNTWTCYLMSGVFGEIVEGTIDANEVSAVINDPSAILSYLLPIPQEFLSDLSILPSKTPAVLNSYQYQTAPESLSIANSLNSSFNQLIIFTGDDVDSCAAYILTPNDSAWNDMLPANTLFWIAYNVPSYHIDYQANSNSSTTLSAITHTQLIDFFNTMPTSYPVVHDSITFNEPEIEGYDFDGYMALQTVPIDILVPNNAPNGPPAIIHGASYQSQYLARPIIARKEDGPYTSRPYTVYYRKGGVWQTLPIALYSESYADGKSTSNAIAHLTPLATADKYDSGLTTFTTIYADPGTTIYIVDDSAGEYNWAVPHFADYSINTFLNVSNVISLTVPDILPYDIVTSKGDVYYSYSLFLKLQVTDAYTTLLSATEEDDMTDMVTYTVVETDMFNSSSDYPDPVVYDKSNMFSDKKEAWLIDEMLELDIHQPMILTPDDYGDYVLIPVLHPHEYTVQFIDPGTESKIGETSIVYNTSLVELLLTTLGPNYQTTVNDNFAQVLAHTYQTPCVVDSYYIIQNGQHIPYDFTTPVTSDLDIYVKFHTPGLEYHFIFNDYSKTNIRPSSNISDDDAVQLFGVDIVQGNGETEFRLHIDSAEHDITDMETQYPLFKSITGYTNKYGFDLDAQVDLYLDAHKEQTADIHELSTDIELTLSADTLFDSSAYHLTSYNIYSVHNGILYECPVTYDSNTNMFTFKVHQFSPFELVYTTEKNEVPTTSTPSKTSSQSDNNKSETKSETKSEDNTSHNTNSDEQSSDVTSNNVAPAETSQPIIHTVTEAVTNTGARAAQTWDDTDTKGRILLILTALLCILAIIGIPLYSKKHK